MCRPCYLWHGNSTTFRKYTFINGNRFMQSQWKEGMLEYWEVEQGCGMGKPSIFQFNRARFENISSVSR